MEQRRNRDQKCAVILLLDTSGSMQGVGIDELNKALEKLKEDILSDAILSNRLEIGVISFDDDARVERPIDMVTVDTEMPNLSSGGTTNLVAGMNKAMDEIEERKRFYKDNGEQYYRPFIVLFSDGVATNTPEELDKLGDLIQQRSDERKFVFLPFGVDGADMNQLAKLAAQTPDERLSKKARVWKMTDLTKFSEVFAFVSSSISTVMTQGSGPMVAQLDPSVAQAITFDLSA